MQRIIKKWRVSLLTAAVLISALFPLQTVYAATLTSPATNITAATDTGMRDWLLSNITSSSASTGNVSMTVAGGSGTSRQGYLTLTYTGSSKAILTFTVSTSGTYSSLTIGGSSHSGSDYSFELTNGESVAVYMQVARGNTATVTLSSVSCKEILEGPATITYNEYGSSVTVGGTLVANGGTSATIPAEGAEFVATPVSGATFVAWINKDTNEILSQEATTTLKPYATSMNIEAVFTKPTEMPYYKVGATLYTDLNEAITTASSATVKTVILISNGTLPTNSTYNIPDGVSFLAPYSKSDLTIGSHTDTNGFNSTLEHANVDFVTADSYGDNGGTVTGIMEPNTAVTYTLTIPSTTTVNVQSGAKFVVGGTLVGGTYATTGIVSATAGAHSNIQLEGTINVGGGGILSTCGYILGGGTVNVASSGTVYQPHVFMDHKDGHYAYGAKEENSGNGYWPYNRHSLMNIRATLVLNSGSDMYGYVSMFTQPNSFASAQYNVTSTHIVGSSGELALFQLGSGTTMTTTYNESKTLDVTSNSTNISRGYYTKVGRTNITFRGDVTLGNIEMTLNVLNSDYNLSTEYSPFPISYNYNIVQESGTFYANNHMSLLPGSTFTVNNGAGLTIASEKNFVIFDGLRDYAQRSESVTLDGDDQTGGTWPVYHYPSSANLKSYGFSSTAELIINGTLTVNGNLGGTVQTTGTTGIIVMDASAGTSATAQFGVQHSTVNLVVIEIGGSSGKTVRTLEAQVQTANEDPLQLEAGKTYVVASAVDTHTINNYSYSVYASHNASTATVESRTDLNAVLTGTWKCQTCTYIGVQTSAPTCTEPGVMTYTCSVCGHSYTEEIPANGHTEVVDAAVAATCTSTGLTEGSHCSVCSTVIVAQEVVPTLSHRYSTATYDTASTCSVCTDAIHSARIGETQYTTLKEAVEAAESGSTITLLTNISGDISISQNVTIHKNGNEATIAAGDGFAMTETEDTVTIYELTVKIAGTSVTAADCLDIYFYVDTSTLGEGDYYAVISRTRLTKDTSGKYTIETTEPQEPIYRADWTVSGDYLRFCYQGIAAKEMTDPVSVTIYDANGNQVSATITESIESYALRSLEKHTDEKLHTALVDMLNYGAAAQTYFGYKIDDLANAELTSDQKLRATQDDAIAACSNITTWRGYTLAGATVTAESNLYFTFYFEGISDPSVLTAEITYTDHRGNSHTSTILGEKFIKYDNYYGPRLEGIAVADGNVPITCTLKQGDTIVATATSSVVSYAVATIENENNAEKTDLVELCNMLMKFVHSAYEYFHQNDSAA